MGRHKVMEILSQGDRDDLVRMLRERSKLLLRLRDLSIKRIAYRYNVHPMTLYRIDIELNGIHLHDPALRCVKRSEIEEPAM